MSLDQMQTVLIVLGFVFVVIMGVAIAAMVGMLVDRACVALAGLFRRKGTSE